MAAATGAARADGSEQVMQAPSEMEDGLVVVLPSLTFPPEELRKIVGIQHYEERLLCLLLFLRNPRLRMLFLSSVRIPEPIVDYYLSFLDDPAGAADRLYVLAIGDASPRALTEKVIEDPYAAKRIKELARDAGQAWILPFNVAEPEARLSEMTGVRLYGPDLSLVPLGSKSGSRRIAKRAGVPVLTGAEDLYSVPELERAIEELRARDSNIASVVIKLNNGFSGQGNAILNLRTLDARLEESPIIFCASEETWDTFGPKIETEGAIVEELVREPRPTSPSVQMRILPDGSQEIISTHDQMLGGPDDQVYLGCRFPADASHRGVIQGHARSIAKELATEGVIGSFAMDFIVTPDRRVFLSEINLRMGGTTHPFLMARYASRGSYDEATGELMTAAGPRCYLATDNLKSDRYVGIDPEAILAAVRDEGLGFDRSTGSGILLHLLGAIRAFGKIGATCVAESISDAEVLYASFVGLLDELSASYGH